MSGEQITQSALSILRSILDSMGDAVIIVDKDGKIVLFNRVAESILGYGPVEGTIEDRLRQYGNFLPDMITPFPLERHPLPRALNGEFVEGTEIFIKNERRPEGVWVTVAAGPVRQQNGEINGGVVVFRDISKQKRSEQLHDRLQSQLRQSQKLESIGILAGGIAHDFNNLLMGVLGNVGLALMEVDEFSTTSRRLQEIQTAARRLSELTNQLLVYSGRGRINKEMINISNLVREMAELLKPAISKKAEIVFEMGEEPPKFDGDPTQVRQVVMNLITNASDALQNEPGQITISTGRMYAGRAYLEQCYIDDNLPDGDYVFVEIADSGIGMTHETMLRIFDPFFTTKFKGRGLGLAAVLGIVRKHGGALRVNSKQGSGTSFTVLFPVAPGQESKREAEMERPSIKKGSGTVLVIDDEELVRNIAKEILESFGYDTLTAADGREGISQFARNRDQISAVLLDMTMPDLSGEEVLEQIRTIRKDVGVVLSSGYLDKFQLRSLDGSTPIAYLPKPYTPQDLAAKIDEVTHIAGGKSRVPA